MSIAMKSFALAAAGAASLGLVVDVMPGAAAACDIYSATDVSCPGANMNPLNPVSVLHNPANPGSLMNPSNPNSPLNINNPANPASPNNPSNPASPLNADNPANPAYQMHQQQWQQGQGYYGAPSGINVLGLLAGIASAGQPAPAADPSDGYGPEAAPVVRHRHHRRHRHVE